MTWVAHRIVCAHAVWTILALRYNDVGDADALDVLLDIRQYTSFGFFCLLALALSFVFVKLIRLSTNNSAVLVCAIRDGKSVSPRHRRLKDRGARVCVSLAGVAVVCDHLVAQSQQATGGGRDPGHSADVCQPS